MLVQKSSEKYSLADVKIEHEPIQRITDDLILDAIQNQRSKSFFRRNFGPVSPGGIRSSVLTLFGGTVGAGVLSLPHVCLLVCLFEPLDSCAVWTEPGKPSDNFGSIFELPDFHASQ